MKPARQLTAERMIRALYRKLARAWGPQHWWPAESPFEVIAGAILTQNTAWANVERAIASLRAAGVLSVGGIREVGLPELEQLVRSSGYYRRKARRLKRFVAFLDETYGGSVERMFTAATQPLRTQLLSLNGIGHETADAILLYAGNHEIFVVDAYARRILERHGAIGTKAGYEDIRVLVERALQREQGGGAGREGSAEPVHIHAPTTMSEASRPPLAQIYNEMHGLLVQVGKHYCGKAEAKCEKCPLRSLLPDGKRALFPPSAIR
ncbi:MAG TPA: endonuclease III domain-containing protein [Candidatus Binatia bacterium]|nr:endonuclease III domain-containing protein [Candidatus Binatia bacterium]